jgi:hypothetical protein
MSANAKKMISRQARIVVLAMGLVLGAELLLVSLAHAFMAPPAEAPNTISIEQFPRL